MDISTIKNRLQSIQDSCPRTRATECFCESINNIQEAEQEVIAVCNLEHSDTVTGTIMFMQRGDSPTLVKGSVSGLKPGKHGFHIHEYGDLSKGCESAGAHYNPDDVDHRDLEQGHVGDLENIEACFSPGVSCSKYFEDDLTNLFNINCHLCDFSTDLNKLSTPIIKKKQTALWLFNSNKIETN